MDATTYCGIGTLIGDSRTDATNYNNTYGSYSRVDSGCWGLASSYQSVEAHELMHNLGAVQATAPHSTGGHCYDEWDLMCYDDGAGYTMDTSQCPDHAHDKLF